MSRNYGFTINDENDARQVMLAAGLHEEEVESGVSHAVFKCIKLKAVPAEQAEMIRHKIISVGGYAILLNGSSTNDILLLATLNQYGLWQKELQSLPEAYKNIAQEVDDILTALKREEYSMPLKNGQTLCLGQRTCLMGILNVTPDSFSDGGSFLDPGRAIEHAWEMREAGADIIDIGGVSSRPGAVIAGPEEEWQRICPVLQRLSRENFYISIDTFRAYVAERALEGGADLINDIGRLQLDKNLLPVLVKYQAPVIIMHNRMQMQAGQVYQDLIADIIGELDQSKRLAVNAGLPAEKIIVDPGVGFGKTPAQNRMIIKRLRAFKSLGCPVLLGTSRKSFINDTLPSHPQERLEASLATAAWGAMNGADILRVHDVKETKKVITMIDAVKNELG